MGSVQTKTTTLIFDFVDYDSNKDNNKYSMKVSFNGNTLLEQSIATNQIITTFDSPETNIKEKYKFEVEIKNIEDISKLTYKLSFYENRDNTYSCFLHNSDNCCIEFYVEICAGNHLTVESLKSKYQKLDLLLNSKLYSIPLHYTLNAISFFTLINQNPNTIEVNKLMDKDSSSKTLKAKLKKTKIKEFKFCLKVYEKYESFHENILTVYDNTHYDVPYIQIVSKMTNETKHCFCLLYNLLYNEVINLINSINYNTDYSTFFESLQEIISQFKNLRYKNRNITDYLKTPIKFLTLNEEDKQLFSIDYFLFVVQVFNSKYQTYKTQKATYASFKRLLMNIKIVKEHFIQKQIDFDSRNYDIKSYIEHLLVFSITLADTISNSNESTIEEPKLVNIETLKQFNPNNYYIQAIQFFREIILNLEENSALTSCCRQLNSKISNDLNLNNDIRKRNSFEIEYIPLKALKEDLLSLIPEHFYRIYSKAFFYAMTIPSIDAICFNEYTTFNEMSKELLNEIYLHSEDKEKLYTFPILFLLFHERMGHSKIRHDLYNMYKTTPYKFSFFGKESSLSDKDCNNELYTEAGKIVEKFIGKKICDYLMNPQSDVNSLFDYRLFIEEDFSNLERKIEKIMEEEKQPSPFSSEDTIYNNKNTIYNVEEGESNEHLNDEDLIPSEQIKNTVQKIQPKKKLQTNSKIKKQNLQRRPHCVKSTLFFFQLEDENKQ